MARLKYDPETMVKALIETKGMVTLAARTIGCDEDTIHRYAKRFPIIQRTIHSQRNEFLDVAELALYKQVQAGEAWAVCFTLKTLGKERGYVERQEVDMTGRITVDETEGAYERLAGKLTRQLLAGADGARANGKAPKAAHANGSSAA